MRNTESVANAAVAGKTFKAAGLSTAPGVILSYQLIIAEKTGEKAWKVLPSSPGAYSMTTAKHLSGIARELHLRGMKVTRA